MAIKVKARYEGSVLKPLEKLDLLVLLLLHGRTGIPNIATNDPDFERVDWLTIWKP